MNKKNLLEKIICELEQRLVILTHSAADADRESQQEQNVPLSQIDHRALEASMLASAQLERVREAQQVIQVYRQLPVRPFQLGDEVQPSALVELEHDGRSYYVFLGPQGAGTVVDFDGHPVEVITPHSPLGEELLEKQVHDEIFVESPRGIQEYRIKSIA
ncbi:GreA/GreB family elongation factor [Pseudobacteriovorax antillogorgiicola]|uniref:GreA/GreB family elongation factor n=1 Tax=Pseudobacteriovorax antillogorgiicola TaxID=1513793 RepID=A0A1Y6CST6_9BACT|nr:GreA/GreB family elongation factor [Pseudobacteriovorax antillogorgiicola]TCS44982.1 GreA/GreB family elongation factor [Pseudobacteriovorax antillogorgiicola]SMF76705.1 GreA/GreB family elongation factor [Pseudobacteriovorax antillogorgiicola]